MTWTLIRIDMQFEPGHLYHIYNQGNNRQPIFLKRENYLYFIRKIRVHVLPYADILAWCLMPNHFHLMVYVNCVGLVVSPRATQSCTRTNVTFNKSIGIMLASYTRAINKQENWTGSLFRNGTKAIILSESKGISFSCKTNTGAAQFSSEYPNVCFNYILSNPLRAKLVKRVEDWEFSSYLDIMAIRNLKLINRERIEEFGLQINSPGATEVAPGLY